MNPVLLALRDEIDQAHERFDKAVAKEQLICDHKEVRECDYQPSNFFSTLPPMAVCLNCGLSEEDWGPGYKVLRSGRRISRDTLYGLRAGLSINDHDKTLLIQKKATLADLVDKDKREKLLVKYPPPSIDY